MKRIRDGYVGICVLLVNAAILFAIINVGLGFQRFYQRNLAPDSDPVTEQYGERVFDAYPGQNRDEVRAMLHEVWSRPVSFRLFTHFAERPVKGEHVNVSAMHSRSIGPAQAPWPPSPERFNIFVFGGSTTFGYGVTDRQTIPAYLQAALERAAGKGGSAKPVAVYNFGQGWFFSTQERLLFEDLILLGHVPDAAVFIDGFNDSHLGVAAQPAFTPEQRAVFDSPNSAYDHARRLLAELPLGRVLGRLVPKPLPQIPTTPAEWTERAERVITGYARNQEMVRAVAERFGVRLLFVWQPIPYHRFDDSKYPFGPASQADRTLPARVYELMAERFGRDGVGPDMLDLSAAHEQVGFPVFCDVVHYSPPMCERIGTLIAERIGASGWLTPKVLSRADRP